MPDTRENQEAYPQVYNQKPGVGFPIARLGALISLACGAIVNLGICQYAGKGQGEVSLLRTLWDTLRPGDILLTDALLANWANLVMLQERGLEFVGRLNKAHRKADFRRGQRLGHEDHVVQWRKPTSIRSLDREEYHALPEFITVRETRVRVFQPGFRTRSIVVVTTLLDPEQTTRAPPDGRPHFTPRAKSVLWIFLSGGLSHLESFDPKPALNKYAGKTFAQTPHADPLRSPLFHQRSRAVVGGERPYPKIFPLQVGFKRHGQAGVEISDWWPHLATCVDDMAFVRSMYTTDNDHAAEFQMHHGRHALDEKQPVLGSWVHYGLGTLNENLPQFVFLGQYKDMRVKQNFAPDYLGPRHAGVELSLDPHNPLPFGTRGQGVMAREQQEQFAFVNELNNLTAAERPEDEQLRARIKSYELAYRMQKAVPEVLDLSRETRETQRLYGIDNPTT